MWHESFLDCDVGEALCCVLADDGKQGAFLTGGESTCCPVHQAGTTMQAVRRRMGPAPFANSTISDTAKISEPTATRCRCPGCEARETACHAR